VEGLARFWWARTGGLEMSALSLSSAFCISFVQRKQSDFFNTLYRGEPALPKLGHEVAEGREVSHEPLNVLDVPDLAYLSDGQNLVGVCLNAALGDDVPQELAPGDSEGAFLWVQHNVEPPEVVEFFF
jgi:hypothetical protein